MVLADIQANIRKANAAFLVKRILQQAIAINSFHSVVTLGTETSEEIIDHVIEFKRDMEILRDGYPNEFKTNQELFGSDDIVTQRHFLNIYAKRAKKHLGEVVRSICEHPTPLNEIKVLCEQYGLHEDRGFAHILEEMTDFSYEPLDYYQCKFTVTDGIDIYYTLNDGWSVDRDGLWEYNKPSQRVSSSYNDE